MGGQKTVVVAMSGGVDSSVAAALLKEQGYDVVGVTLQIWQENTDQGRHGGCCSLGAVEDARRVANRLGIPHYVLNFRDYFAQQVIGRFVAEYARGRTPNPCVECNRTVKFRELMRQAWNLGADYLATGHYARIRHNSTSGRWELWRAADQDKDQSYVLHALTQEQLAHTLFPLGDVVSKAETRQRARDLGLNVADKPDSQDICFVPAGGYTQFLAEHAPEALRPGPIIDLSGHEIGRHDGIANYTIGQRRRLPASSEGALYVVALDPANNAVVVGSDSALKASRLIATDISWLSIEGISGSLAVSARIRYNAPTAPARIEPVPDRDAVLCTFDTPQRAITPGQYAVFYDGDRVLGGGPIEEASR